jgi:hypothetical protein
LGNLMPVKYCFTSKTILRSIFLFLGAFALVGLFTASLFSPAQAAQGDNLLHSLELTCSPPNDWNQTARLKNPQKPTKEWTFSVDGSEMNVRLVFFYYQDYDRSGCPYECSTGDCQTDEVGKGSSPLGNIVVIDGKEGANRGVKQLEGSLPRGTYKVVFTANGDPGSLNIGLQVHQESLPTETPAPTNTPIPTAIIPTATPTPTEPEPTSSPTKPGLPEKSPTPTDPKRTPPATLPPPTPFPGSATPMILIPETGAGLSTHNEGIGFNGWLLVPLGIGFIGIGLVFYGIATRLKT